MTTQGPLRIVVLISGSGTNLQAMIDQIHRGDTPARIVAVISNKAEAYGLKRAEQAGIPAEVLSHRGYASREDYDRALQQLIDGYQPDLLVLAGFMRILTDAFTRHYQGRMINIHPSLLPRHKGLNTHQRVLEAGDPEHGCSVHYVTAELDGGPVILQASVPVEASDTPESLAQKVHEQEHRIYPRVIDWIARGRVRLEDDTVLFDNQPLTEQQRRYRAQN
ncbi:phosphoribosylglycinamide formyltransferase [Thiohalophilus thiocyanatoxydans]|uniref:Phosphoribosylglycinamide formyltransferase n=1 Tax=Thiohalophilus thiocyanatoxydans TaxID=381308 RepID=A0A4R8ILD4_9GAMM|nr:phosphoribosylglycinamide formyltransferase [Thiohalophilus thiocyanatoxydans]TDY01602.1 formyltetrahydrofolate-dependent phosphoribosylglycinamide formyltransferase [Thiohalophilus thiocyanatoxydans]